MKEQNWSKKQFLCGQTVRKSQQYKRGSLRNLFLFLTILFLLFSIKKSQAQSWEQVMEAVAIDAEDGDLFGRSVAFLGDYAIVGASGEDEGGSGAGAAYIFKRTGDTWLQETKLTASDAAANDAFGTSVALSGNYAIIGTPGKNIDGNKPNAGAAYIFKRTGSTWTEEAKLTANIPASNDRVGRSVALSGDYAFIGNTGGNGGGANAEGVVYVFKRTGSNWTEEATLTASDGASDDGFWRIAVSGDYMIIGAATKDPGGVNAAGGAYIFKWTGSAWVEEAILTASDAEAVDFFGISVAISGDYAIIGAINEDTGGSNAGAAYIFKRDGINWNEEAKLMANNAGVGDEFGTSVAISGDYAFVGAENEDTEAFNSGAVYVFKRTGSTWTQQAQLTPSNVTSSSYSFGNSLAISGEEVLIGAFFSHTAAIDAGSVYFFKKNQVCNALSLDGTDNYVECGNDVAFNANNIQTMEAWVKFDDLTGDQEILSKSSPGIGIELLIYQNNLSFFCMGSGNLSSMEYPVSNLNTNQWYHIAGSWDGSTKESMQLYVDGVSVGTRNDIGDINSSGISDPVNGFRIGTWWDIGATDPAGTRFLKATIDEARVWSTTRSASQIQNNRFNELTGSETGLIAYYNFNQGRVGESNAGVITLNDQAGNFLNGTLNGFNLSGNTSNWVIGITPEINIKQGIDDLPNGTGIYDFGEILQNTSSTVVTFTIENTGINSLNLTTNPRVVISGTHESDFTLVTDAPSSISPTVDGTFQIQFTPSGTGTRNAIITIANNDKDEENYIINLTGIGKEGTPVMELSEGGTPISNTTLIDYGTATWGTNGMEKTFLIENTGSGDLLLNESNPIIITGSEGHFTITQQPATTIPPTGSTNFKVQFTPQSANLETESILIFSNEDDFTNPRPISIRGQGQREVLNTPSNFTATALSDKELQLTWDDNSINETGFVLSKSLTGLADSYLTLEILEEDITNYIDNSLTANQQAYYRLQAISERGESNEIFTDERTKNPPQAPEGLLVSTLSQSQIVLIWEDKADNETGFSIERSLDANEGFTEVAIVGLNVSTYTDNGLSNGVEYFYRVKATNFFEGDSPYSNVSGARTSDVPPPPANVTVSMNPNDDVLVTWQDNADNEERFRVERFSVLEEADTFVEIARLPAGSTTFTDTTTNPNQLYTYRLRASNADGISLESNLASIETPFDPTVLAPNITPQGLLATPVTESEITLSWNPITSGIDFTANNFVRIEMATHPDGPFTEIDQIMITENTYQAIGLDKNVVYYFRIRFGNGGGNSPYSSIVSALTECRLIVSVSDDKEDVVTSACNGKSVILFAKTNAIEANFQWTKDGLTLPNSNQRFYYATTNGKYNCIVTAGDCPPEEALVPVVVTINNPISVSITQKDNLLEASLNLAETYQWYQEEEAIKGANSFQFNPNEDGLYYVVVSQNSCSSTSNAIFFTTTDVNETISEEILVYPNPTSDYIEVSWENDYLGFYSLSIYDLAGKKYELKKDTKSNTILQEHIDLSVFKSGMYLLELKGEDFQAIKKVVKE